MRSFIAVPIPKDVAERLTKVQHVLDTKLAKIAFVPPEKMHITLLFLGDISSEQAHNHCKKLEAIHFAPLDITLSCIGTFSESNIPRVVWAGVHKNDELRRLHANITRVLEVQEPLAEHVTLGRIKHVAAANKVALNAHLKKMDLKPVSFRANSYTFFESKADDKGIKHYNIIQSFNATH